MKNKIDHFKLLLTLAGSRKIALIFSAALSVIGSAFEIMIFVMLHRVLLAIMRESIEYSELIAIGKYTALFIVANIAAGLLSGVISHIAAFDILCQIRIKVCEHLPKLHMGFFNKNTIGELKKTINEDVEKLELFLAHQIPDFVTAMVSPVLILGIMIYFNRALGLIMLIPAVLAVLSQRSCFKKYSRNMTQYNVLQRKMNTAIVQFIKGMSVFKAFNISSVSFKQLGETSENHTSFWLKVTKEALPSNVNYSLLLESGTLFSVPVGGYLLIKGQIDFPAFLMIVLLSIILFKSFEVLLSLAREFNILLEGVGNIQKVLDTPTQKNGGKILDHQGPLEIEYKNVTFAYENVNVLKNISFKIPGGAVLALVGASGSGKTTVTQLLGRFWDVSAGGIYINGTDVRDIEYENLMSKIAFVFQQVFLLKDTVYENIRMGLNKTEAEIRDAAKKAQIHELILSLPDGYNTRIGKNGLKLSTGEAQRISIARCILKDAPIVVLDEITAYADVENEHKIQEALNELLKNKTVIVIAHRLYTIQNAAKIIVLDEGQIKEQGPHQALMDNNGIYRRLWDIHQNQLCEREG
jgi:ATP-binding cassette subfamily B protein IrtA